MPPKDAEIEAQIADASRALDLDPKLKVAAAMRQFSALYKRLL